MNKQVNHLRRLITLSGIPLLLGLIPGCGGNGSSDSGASSEAASCTPSTKDGQIRVIE